MRHSLTKGFTVVELLVVISVSGLLTGMLFGPMTDLYYSNINSVSTVLITADSKSALRSIQSDATLATSFNSQSTYGTFTDPAGAKGDGTATQWNDTGTTHYSYTGYGTPDVNSRVLILSTYATNKLESQDTYQDINGGGTAPTRLVWLKADCTTPIQNNIIYFVKPGTGGAGGTLYRRTIPDNTTAKCSSQSGTIAQKQSCPKTLTGVAACKAIDAVIATNVDQFSIDYYLNANDTSPISYGTDPTPATSIYITLKVHNGSGSNLVTSTSKLMITRINGANT